MTLDSLIFIDSLPTLDLHGFDRESARVYINDFIRDNIQMKNPFLVIIHGIGSGIIRKEVCDTLKSHKKVVNYKVAPFNEGCTLVQIKV